MNLAELIAALEAADPNLILPNGFASPHTYWGGHQDVAFEPATGVTVAAMLTDARSALGQTFTYCTGPDGVMDGDTRCWLARDGYNGKPLEQAQLGQMLAAGAKTSVSEAE